MDDSKILPSNYGLLLNDVKSIIDQGLSKAYKAVDNLKVQTYWQIGERIVREELKYEDRAGYGKNIIDNLSRDLDIDRRLFYRIVRFYRLYPIVVTVSPQLSWSHYEVLTSIGESLIRRFYENASIRNSWSIRELRRQIKNKMYESVKDDGKMNMSSPLLSNPAVPENVFKNIYNFDFLGLEDRHQEAELEKSIISNMDKMLPEFGADFSFSGRQKKIIIDGQIHAVDIELYHRGIPCVVLVELKTGRFKGEYIGQMNKYCQSHDIE